jgi:hypothetical protein
LVVRAGPQAVEVKITECLWAKTYHVLSATEIGYWLICYRDYDDCQGFKPRITLTRSKTRIQGDDCCNHRFAWEG